MSFEINDATRDKTPISVALSGMSGSGKTYSALLLARGLVGPDGKIGIADTEGGRAKVYADDPAIGGFRHLDFSPPYSPQQCREALDALVADGCQCIILDSASLEHDGEGGLLEMAEEEADKILARNPNNRAVNQQKWTLPKQLHKRFLNHAVGLPVYVIFTFRTTLTTDFDKNQTVETVVMEKNTPFSFEMHGTIDRSNNTTWTRVPKPYLSCIEQGKPITVEAGGKLAAASAGEVVASNQPDDSEANLESLQQDMATMIESDGIEEEWFNRGLKLLYTGKYENWRELPANHLGKLATDEGFQKVKAQAEDIMRQEGVMA